MSRYRMETGVFTVIVGWDPPLDTYFAQVWDPRLQEHLDGGCVYWIGTHPGGIKTIEALQGAISSYVMLPREITAQLRRDQAESKPPTPLQQWVAARLWNLNDR